MKKSFLSFVSTVIVSLAFTQNNVGIGTTSPQATLHVKTTTILEAVRLEAPNPRLSFWNPTAFQGAIGTNGTSLDIFTSSVVSGTPLPITISPGAITAATILSNGNVGIGNTAPASKLDVSGDINVTGAVKVAGNAGIAGQVLASNGAGMPSWRSAALANNTRFSVTMTPVSGDGTMFFSSKYNTNPTDISMGTNIIYFNHAGLYHFEGLVSADATFGAPPSSKPNFSLTLFTGGDSYLFMNEDLTQFSTTSFSKTERFNMDLYLTAGAGVYLSRVYSGGATTNTTGWFTGYLISD